MGWKSLLSKPFAWYVARQVRRWSSRPLETQERVFRQLLETGRKTVFGRDHHFSEIHTYEEFKARVPIRDYEGFKPYIERIKNGEEHILWKGRPIYLAKTSGTTSGVKYIPITRESIPNHINSARNALLMFIAETGRAGFVNGKMIFLSGSPELTDTHGIPTGRLSGIANHHVPAYLRKNQLPSYPTNCIEEWEEKLSKIIDETMHADMSLISGIPPWVQMYFDWLSAKTGGKMIKDIFPNFSMLVYGGVNFEPYRAKMERSIGKKIDAIELYPASEGFIAYQDSQKRNDLLLLLDEGIFYEFIPADEFFNPAPTRITLKEVKPGINYVIILNTNAGLWGYNIGDTVKFTSVNPYRIVVTGRIKHFISAFGEHVISEEVEKALRVACEAQQVEVVEFTVAPQVNPAEGLPYHEWLIEFAVLPADMEKFRQTIDATLQKLNIYYADLKNGNMLQTLKITPLRRDAFINYMKSEGKLGGQNKVPRLSNDRTIAEGLKSHLVNSF